MKKLIYLAFLILVIHISSAEINQLPNESQIKFFSENLVQKYNGFLYLDNTKENPLINRYKDEFKLSTAVGYSFKVIAYRQLMDGDCKDDAIFLLFQPIQSNEIQVELKYDTPLYNDLGKPIIYDDCHTNIIIEDFTWFDAYRFKPINVMIGMYNYKIIETPLKESSELAEELYRGHRQEIHQKIEERTLIEKFKDFIDGFWWKYVLGGFIGGILTIVTILKSRKYLKSLLKKILNYKSQGSKTNTKKKKKNKR